MCRRVECSKCKRPTFAGCGAHVEQVLADVPKPERCQCRQQAAEKAKPDGPPGQRSWFANLLGKHG